MLGERAEPPPASAGKRKRGQPRRRSPCRSPGPGPAGLWQWRAGPGGVPAVPVASGRSIPVLGLGNSYRGGYSHALQGCGIRHIDTAKRYGCESLLQRAIRDSGVKEDLWITTKLWPTDYGCENTKKACLESCERLGVEYLDLYLIHWPDAQVPGKSNEVQAETWRAMEELHEKGLCKSISVSNFLISHLEQLKEDCVITPHVNQVEYHPFQRPQELVDYCRSRDIVFEGYCPLAKGEALTHPIVIELAKKYGRTPAQICIRWSIQNGIVTIPKSTKAERIEENCKVFDFTIAEDVEILNGMHDGRHVSWDQSFIV
ncbi:LOW QUALITY PROTEIN: putative oxidoreductase YtbE [Sylvia borin]